MLLVAIIIIIDEKAVREGAVCRVCGDMPSTSDGGQVH